MSTYLIKTPQQIAGLTGWYDAFDPLNNLGNGGSQPANNASISTWYDKSGAGVNLAQGTGANQPTFVLNSLNGNPSIRFDGVNDCLTKAALSSSIMFPNSQLTAFFVLKITRADSNPQLILAYADVPGNPRFNINIQATTAYTRFDFPDDGSGQLADSTAFPVNTAQILTVEKKDPDQTIFINGTSTAAQSNSLTTTPYTADFTLGIYSNTSQFPLEGNIGEVIFYNRGLTTTERENVETYLSNKWAISI